MLQKRLCPILEFDPAPKAFFSPRAVYSHQGRKFHERVVFCFFRDVLSKLVKKRQTRKIAVFKSEMGQHPAYEVKCLGRPLTVMHPGVGAPLAGAFMDEAIAMGGRKFVACGGAGVLRKDIAVGHLLVPTSAVRDEGLSYHYLRPGREARPHPKALAAVKATLKRRGYPFLRGKTWTTDGFYRETPAKIALRQREGCLTVEMECAAFFAVAKFRKVQCAQILYGGDDLSGEKHDDRGWHEQATVREKVFWLAAEACASL